MPRRSLASCSESDGSGAMTTYTAVRPWASASPGRVRRRVGDDRMAAEQGTATRGARRVAVDRLLLTSAEGDQTAFAGLYDATASVLYGIVVRVLRDPARAEEVTQEVYVEVWRRATRFDPERGSGMAWMCTIAHRRAIDAVRKEQASRDRDKRVAQLGSTAYDSVAGEVEAGLEREQVRTALDQLSELQREAVELAYYGGRTYREVAEELGAPLGTVKTRLRDGLRRLGQVLGADDG